MKAIVEIFDNSITLDKIIKSTLGANISIEDSSINIQAITNAKQLTVEMVIGNTIKGDDGKSAYEIWLKEGHQGSEADFITWLQKPANDAADDIPQLVDESIQEIADVLATSDCTLEERIDQLERLLLDVLSGKVLIPELQVRRLGVWGGSNLILAGPGAPAKAPDRAGQLYIDITARALYYSTGNAAVSDWKNA